MPGKIKRLDLKSVWKHEALDFTTWLQENIDTLSEIVDFSLINVEREQPAGNFNVDLVAEDEETGQFVIIENQFGKSDHDHLGKLLTYISNVAEVKSAIWIVPLPRPEHISAIAWLNKNTNFPFYLVKLEAIQIDDSRPAPLFTVIEGPDKDNQKLIESVRTEKAERYIIRKQFWTGLLNYAKKVTKLHSTISPGEYAWVGTSSGVRGINYNYAIRKEDAQVEVYIDDQSIASDIVNEARFEELYKYKASIEKKFGDELLWERLEDKRACRIRYVIKLGGFRTPQDQWLPIQKEMVERMIKLEAAMREYVLKIKNSTADDEVA